MMKSKSTLLDMGGNKATYLGMGVEKASNAEFGCIIPDSANYEDAIHRIEIPHERTRHPDASLTVEEPTILRLELGKLMWIALIARPGSIYDASAAAQTFSGGRMVDVAEGKEDISENGENGIF